MLLVYGGNTGRNLMKRAAVYILQKQSFAKIGNKMFWWNHKRIKRNQKNYRTYGIKK